MVRYVYIRPVQNIGKKLVILLRGCARWSEFSLLQRLFMHYIYSIILACLSLLQDLRGKSSVGHRAAETTS